MDIKKNNYNEFRGVKVTSRDPKGPEADKYMKKGILKRLKNTGTILALTSAIIMIITNLGVNVDSDKIMFIVNTLCSLGVALGVLNNPTTPGLDNPVKRDKE